MIILGILKRFLMSSKKSLVASPKFQQHIFETRNLSNMRDTLLPKLISGELKIPDTENLIEEAGI